MEADNKLSELREYLEKQGYTQESIAKRFDVSKQAINALLTGRKPFGKQNAQRWANEFGLSAAWLITGEGEMLASTTADKESALLAALNELSETRKLLAEAVAANKEQTQRFLNIIEKLANRQ